MATKPQIRAMLEEVQYARIQARMAQRVAFGYWRKARALMTMIKIASGRKVQTAQFDAAYKVLHGQTPAEHAQTQREMDENEHANK